VLRPGNVGERQEIATDQQPGVYGWFPNETVPLSEFPELAAHANANKITIRSHNCVLRVPQWGFKFYCQPGRATRSDIERELGKLKPPISVQDIPSVLSNRLADVKDVYYSLFGGASGQNSTSIVCCHGPAVPRGRRIPFELDLKLGGTIGSHFLHASLHRTLYCEGLMWVDGSTSSQFLLPPMTLLTGDANLKLSEFETHFSDELQGIGLTTLAHHGSEHNYRRDFTNVMPNCRLWVASFGLGNKYRHPSKSVIDHLTDRDLTLLQCNESQGVSFTLEGRIS
jgi:competence protein ComEC